MIFKFSAVSV